MTFLKIRKSRCLVLGVSLIALVGLSSCAGPTGTAGIIALCASGVGIPVCLGASVARSAILKQQAEEKFDDAVTLAAYNECGIE